MALRPSQHAAPSRLSTGVAHWQKTPGAAHSRKGPCAGLLNPQAYTLTPSGRGPWCLWSKTYLLNPKQKLLDSKATQGIEPKIEPVTEALTRRNAVPNAAPPASPDVCLTLLARTRYRFCPLLRCAGHSWPSDQRQETGHANKCSASQPPASRRSIGARWPEERSALEMAYSGGDRSHTKGHA